MADLVARMWAKQNKHPGDREALFRAVVDAIEVGEVLYPGSYVDIAASFVFDDVTYVDMDKRAARFFSEPEAVDSIIAANRSGASTWRFIAADFTSDLGLADESFSLLVSLYAGPVSDACARYLRVGGHLLANTSHGDVAMASLDPRFRLFGVVVKLNAGYRLCTDDLDGYLDPKSGSTPTADEIRSSGRGIAYRKQAAAYLFERI